LDRRGERESERASERESERQQVTSPCTEDGVGVIELRVQGVFSSRFEV